MRFENRMEKILIFAQKPSFMEKETEITFPQNFDLKLVVSSGSPIEDVKTAINLILSDCKVAFHFLNVRASSKGNYLSFAYNVEMESKEQLEHTYKELGKLPGLKLAL